MRPSVRVERLSEPQKQLRWQKVLHILMEGVILVVEEGLRVVVVEVQAVEEVRVVVGGAVVEVQVSEGCKSKHVLLSK